MILLSIALPVAVVAQSARPAPTRIDLAAGVYLFQTQPYGDVGLDGNSVVIVSDDGVLVFDSNGTPSAAEAVLTEIRKLTDQPIRYLVNSHWHWDHWYGAEVYRKAFPSLQIITHEKTRQLMAGPAVAFNQPGLDAQLPAHIADITAQLAKARSTNAPAADVARLEEHVQRDQFFLAQKRSVHHTLANITFTDSLTLYLGQRVIKVLHHARAITPGDAYLYLPKERIVVTGDLLINPITFALFCYPNGWISTLESIATLDAAVLVPGHGLPMKDKTLLNATIALLTREREMARDAKRRGRTVEQAKAAILADASVLGFRATITGGDTSRGEAFALYLVDWFVRRVYQELAGPLDDEIPSAP
jgi:glyoxylase-like metal-dependent hydrolase (beta-lactamase superfamily II)